ncbi:MAG: hypothetical protein V3S43_04520 [Acidimicrobiia bacterium]
MNRLGERLAVLQGHQLGTLGISRFDIAAAASISSPLMRIGASISPTREAEP